MSSIFPPADGKARLEDVARLARVSRSTASRAITGAPGVSEEARAAVERAARRLNYSPNRAARSLVTRRTDLIGLVIPEPTSRLFGDPHFPRLIRGVNEELAGRDRQLVLFTPQSKLDEQRLEGHLASGRPLGSVEITYVDVDNLRGGAIAVRHLLAGGRRAITTIAGPQDMVAGQDRLAGHRLDRAAAVQRALAAPRDGARDDPAAAARHRRSLAASPGRAAGHPPGRARLLRRRRHLSRIQKGRPSPWHPWPGSHAPAAQRRRLRISVQTVS